MKIELNGFQARRLFHVLSIAKPQTPMDADLSAALRRLIVDIQAAEDNAQVDRISEMLQQHEDDPSLGGRIKLDPMA